MTENGVSQIAEYSVNIWEKTRSRDAERCARLDRSLRFVDKSNEAKLNAGVSVKRRQPRFASHGRAR